MVPSLFQLTILKHFKGDVMLSTMRRSIAVGVLAGGLAFLVSAAEARAQNGNCPGMANGMTTPTTTTTPSGTTGTTQSALSGRVFRGGRAAGFQAAALRQVQIAQAMQLQAQAYAIQQQVSQAQRNALQAQNNAATTVRPQRVSAARQNAALQTAYELQLIGLPADLAMQTAVRQTRASR
jgi:hypothetical protein